MSTLSLLVSDGRRTLFGAGLLVFGACGGRATPPTTSPAPRAPAAPARAVVAGPEVDAARLYTQMGFLTAGAPMPFVGAVTYLASAGVDSTDVTVGLSLVNTALTFTRDNDRFVAGYSVGLAVRQGGTVIRDIDAHESVRVASFKETSRIDETVVFQQGMLLAPGQYVLSVSVRDDASGRSSAQQIPLTVPKIGGPRSLSTPIPFLRVVPRKSHAAIAELVTNPRATAVFGRDSVMALYLEGYGDGERLSVNIETRNDAGRIIWRDSTFLPRRGDLFSGVVTVPVSKIGIGVAVVGVWPSGGTDTVQAPVFVGFGDGLPVAKFEDMLQYLRWFTSPSRLRVLRDTTPEARPAAWAAFVKATDLNPQTPVNEELLAYFDRLLVASTRFKEEGAPAWMTDRGKVYLGLGEPDQIYDQGLAGVGDRGRSQVWEYRRYSTQFVFYDQTGFGRWRLTNAGEMEFQSQWQRRVNR